jgi:integral membrane protein
MKWDSPLERLRSVGYLEGTSFLLLLGIAMPLKYLAGQPLAVTVIGTAHGFLWILYLLALAIAWRHYGWTFGRVVMGGIASVMPFGPFVFDRSLRNEDS